MDRLATSRFPAPKNLQVPPAVEKSGKPKMTTLPNGFKIASEMGTETGPDYGVSIGLYVDCGAIFETSNLIGVTNLLEGMAFWTTTNRSHQRIEEEMKEIGVTLRKAEADQETIIYAIDGPKRNLSRMVELLVDCVRNPAFLDCEVKGRLQDLKFLSGVFSTKPGRLIMEAIHSTGYTGALTNPTLAPKSAIDRLNSTIIKKFVSENYTASRMVLSAYGVEHEQLLSIVEPLFSDMPYVPLPDVPISVYVGGDYRLQADHELTHFALAFEAPGGRSSPKEAVTLTLLQGLMKSSDLPGKPSRLGVRVLSKYSEINKFSSFFNIHYYSGVFGITATVSSDFVSKAIDIAVKELIAVATPGDVDQEELDSARESHKSGVLKNMESTMAECEVNGREILIFGKRRPVVEVLKALDDVKIEDIVILARKMMSTPLTMACYGDVGNVPSYEEVSSKFKSK